MTTWKKDSSRKEGEQNGKRVYNFAKGNEETFGYKEDSANLEKVGRIES